MKIGIYGYGNLGRGVELAVRQNPDAELAGIFSRRDPAAVKTLTGAPVYAAQDVKNYAGRFKMDGKKIFKIGVNFSSTEKNITEWIAVEE